MEHHGRTDANANAIAPPAPVATTVRCIADFLEKLEPAGAGNDGARSRSAAMSWWRRRSACATPVAGTAATAPGASPSPRRRWPRRARMRATRSSSALAPAANSSPRRKTTHARQPRCDPVKRRRPPPPPCSLHPCCHSRRRALAFIYREPACRGSLPACQQQQEKRRGGARERRPAGGDGVAG